MEVDGETVITGSNPTKVFQAVEHSLDGIPTFVKVRGEAVFPDAGDLGRDVGRCSLGFDFLTHGVGVVSLVAVDQFGRADVIEQRIGGDAIGHLAAGEKKSDRTAIQIGQGMDFGRAPAARASDCLTLLPPFPPEAHRCALTAEESMSNSAGGPLAVARARKRLAQTPLAAHRWKRL